MLELTQTTPKQKRAKIALLVRVQQQVVQRVLTVERVNSKTKSRKHRAKIAQLIHLQIKQDELLVKIAAREKNQKKVLLNAQNVMLENRVLALVVRVKLVRQGNIVQVLWLPIRVHLVRLVLHKI